MKPQILIFIGFFFLLNFNANAACDSCSISNSVTIVKNWKCELIINYNVNINDTCSTYMYSIANYGNGIQDTIYPWDTIVDKYSQGTYNFCLTSYSYYFDSLNVYRLCSVMTCTTVTKEICFNPWRKRAVNEVTSDYNVYPNPTNGDLFITSNRLTSRVRMININGQVMFDQTNLEQSNFQFDVSDYPKGIYLIELFSGEERETQRVIVQ